jgi:hypothetical protein
VSPPRVIAGPLVETLRFDVGAYARDSWERPCELCGRAILLSGSARAILADPGWRTFALCMSCAVLTARQIGTAVGDPTEEQREELRAAGLDDEAIERRMRAASAMLGLPRERG